MRKRRAYGLAAALAVFAALALPGAAPAADELSPAQEKAVERLIERYILDHPETVVRALERFDAERRADQQAAMERAVKARAAELTRDPDAPFAGAAGGDVVLVEFFDYHCGICKRVQPVLLRLLENDRQVKLVYKEWPILGPESVLAARAALASRAQGKYVAFHNELMRHRGVLEESAILAVARRVGLDTGRLQKDMKSPEIDRILKRNFALADALRLSGTPSFVLGGNVIQGGRNYETMRALVEAARKSGDGARGG